MHEFFKAIAENDLELFRRLLTREPSLLQARTEHGVSAILFAVYNRRNAFARELVEAGADVDVFEAAALGNLKRIRELADLDPATVDAFSPDGFQPLGLAAYFGQREIAEYLLDRGADPNSPSRNRQSVTPLHSAASSDNVEIASALIKKGADVNAKQQGGYTPLHSAVQNGSSEMVELLIRNGADCSSRSDAGQTPNEVPNRKSSEKVDTLLKGCADYTAS
jgi:ankyrin repeat protein